MENRLIGITNPERQMTLSEYKALIEDFDYSIIPIDESCIPIGMGSYIEVGVTNSGEEIIELIYYNKSQIKNWKQDLRDGVLFDDIDLKQKADDFILKHGLNKDEVYSEYRLK